MQSIFTRKKVIFFDLHDTLISKQQSFVAALTACLSEFTARWDGPTWKPREIAERYAKEWTDKKAAIKSKAPKKFNSTSPYNRQLVCLRKALIDAPFQSTDDMLQSILKRTKQLVPDYPVLYPDVPETLKQLSDRYQLAILSNGKLDRLEHTLLQAGLKPLFSNTHIFTTSNQKQKKPHPDLFHKALIALRMSADEAVMVGNSWMNDILGATSCGIDAIWLRHNNKRTIQRNIGKNKVIVLSHCKQILEFFK